MPGTYTSLRTIPTPICRHAGVDRAQLLRDIGKASVSTDPLELFRLCLDAQLLLSAIEQSGSAS